MLANDSATTNRPKMKRPILKISIIILNAGLGYFILEMTGFANGEPTTEGIKPFFDFFFFFNYSPYN